MCFVDDDDGSRDFAFSIPLVERKYLVSYNPTVSSNYYSDILNEYPTYLTFNEFKKIWKPLTNEEVKKLNL
jgi:hypothetical protein